MIGAKRERERIRRQKKNPFRSNSLITPSLNLAPLLIATANFRLCTGQKVLKSLWFRDLSLPPPFFSTDFRISPNSTVSLPAWPHFNFIPLSFVSAPVSNEMRFCRFFSLGLWKKKEKKTISNKFLRIECVSSPRFLIAFLKSRSSDHRALFNLLHVLPFCQSSWQSIELVPNFNIIRNFNFNVKLIVLNNIKLLFNFNIKR